MALKLAEEYHTGSLTDYRTELKYVSRIKHAAT